MKLPEHKCSLTLSHNDHRASRYSMEMFIESDKLGEDFESEEAKQRAIATDELWVLQWYPDHPTSFLRVAAPTLEEVLKMAAD